MKPRKSYYLCKSRFFILVLSCFVHASTCHSNEKFKKELSNDDADKALSVNINCHSYLNENNVFSHSAKEMAHQNKIEKLPKFVSDKSDFSKEVSSDNSLNNMLINANITVERTNHFDRGVSIRNKRQLYLNDESDVFNTTRTESSSYFNNETSIVDKYSSFSAVTEDIFDTTSFTEMTTTNYSEEEMPCVGDPDYCNLTKEEYIQLLDEYIFPQPYEWVLIASHTLVFLIGLIGNALVCVAVYRNHSMRTVTNYFIVNLAVADFMVILFCLPPTVLWDVTETWFFGNAMCRIVLYFQSVSVTVSVLTLTFISVDRWYAICFPLKFKSTTGRAKTAICVIWLLSLIFNIPEVVVLETKKSTNVRFELDYFTQCAPTWSIDSDLNWHIVKLVFLYTLPLLLMTIAYCQIVRVLWKSDNIPGHCESHKYTTGTQQNWMSSNRRTTMSAHANASTEGQLRSRRKAAKMLVAVVVMFAVCYFPVHLISVLRYAFDMQQTDVMSFLALLSHWLCYANSAVNPLIYNFMSGFPGFSGKFRREFRRSFFKCSCLGLGPMRGTGSSAQSGPNRAATMRAGTRCRSDSSYHLTHLSPSTYNNTRDNAREYGRSNTSFIENNNKKKIRSDSVSDNPATRLTIATDLDSRQ